MGIGLGFIGAQLGLLGLGHLVWGNHLDHVGLAVAQRHLVAHDAVFYRVVQGRVEQYLHFLALDKSHLDDTLAKAAMAHHLDDNALFASL